LVAGQVVDLESEGKTDITLETLNFIHTHQTAALYVIVHVIFHFNVSALK
jgi:geranylgeranyl pyrophosphate synthase